MLELLGGMAIGGALGWLGAQILRRVALPSSGLYPLSILVWTIFAYGITALVHASGFAAVYVCALILGNAQLPHRAATRSFVEGIGWIAQIGLFVMLGLLAFPDRVTLRAALIAVLAGFFLTLVARPASIVACASWFKIPVRHQVFLSGRGSAERCRSCWPPFRWRRKSQVRSFSSMSCWSSSSSSPACRVRRCPSSPGYSGLTTMRQRMMSRWRLRHSTDLC